MLTVGDADLELAHDLVTVASRAALPFVAAAVTHEAKAGGTPLSAADWAVEAAMLDHLRRYRPHDGILSEESGHVAAGRRRWLLDPIDGTVQFVAGGISGSRRARSAWCLGCWTGSHILELVEGRLDGIVSQKCGYIWDHAPAVALAIESGGHFSDPDGGSRADQHGGTYTNGHLHGALQAALSDGRVGLSGQPGHVHG